MGGWRHSSAQGGRELAQLAGRAPGLERLRMTAGEFCLRPQVQDIVEDVVEAPELKHIDVTVNEPQGIAAWIRGAPALETLVIGEVCTNGLRALAQDLPEGRRIRALSLVCAELEGPAGGQLAARLV